MHVIGHQDIATHADLKLGMRAFAKVPKRFVHLGSGEQWTPSLCIEGHEMEWIHGIVEPTQPWRATWKSRRHDVVLSGREPG